LERQQLREKVERSMGEEVRKKSRKVICFLTSEFFLRRFNEN
jgi:hypothetical protein